MTLVRAALLGLVLPISAPALAVEPSTVNRFVGLSDQFHARLPNSDVAGLSGAQKRARADCILTRFEDAHGDAGVQALMQLMRVLARGTEFDDPTVIAFNERFGGSYDRTVSACTRQARNS